MVFNVLAGDHVDIEQVDTTLGQGVGDAAVDDAFAARRFTGSLEPRKLPAKVGVISKGIAPVWRYAIAVLGIQLFLFAERINLRLVLLLESSIVQSLYDLVKEILPVVNLTFP